MWSVYGTETADVVRCRTSHPVLNGRPGLMTFRRDFQYHVTPTLVVAHLLQRALVPGGSPRHLRHYWLPRGRPACTTERLLQVALDELYQLEAFS